MKKNQIRKSVAALAMAVVVGVSLLVDAPEDVIVENVHLSESLMALSYNLSQYRNEHKENKE